MDQNLPLKQSKKTFLIALSLIFLGLLLVGIGLQTSAPSTSSEQPIITPLPTASALGIEGEETTVVKVVDGDTIEVLGNQKIRYIGIDTPETVDPRKTVQCFGKEASEENKNLVEGKKVILVKDVSETDKYNRLLRYVYLKNEDNSLLFINDYLIRNGFATILTIPPDVKFTDQFKEAQEEAREQNKGLWNKCK